MTRSSATADAGAAELLNAMAPLLNVRPVIDDVCRFGGSWASPHAPNERGWAQFHIVTRGSCIIDRPGLAALRLGAGDLLLLPHGDSHIVRSRRRGVRPPVVVEFHNGIGRRTTAGMPSDTEILCGRLLFETTVVNPLLTALPDEIVVRTADDPLLQRFRRLLTDIRDELDDRKAGAEMIAADLARALFVMMLREYLTGNPEDAGILALLRDRTTARAVRAVLDNPGREWTLDDMARQAMVSRATLVRAFNKHARTTPMAFLSDLRLATARKRLAGTSDTVAKIAYEVGYASEGALSKAIMRKYGVRPGALRIPGPPAHGAAATT